MPLPTEEQANTEWEAVLAEHDIELLRVLAESSRARSIVELQAAYSDPELVIPESEPIRVLCQAARKSGGSVLSIVSASERAQAQVAAVSARLAAAGLLKAANFVVGDGLEYLAGLSDPIDLLFLAGPVDYLAAFEAARPHLRPGSLVIAHNPSAGKTFLDTIRADPNFETTLLEQGDGISVSLRQR